MDFHDFESRLTQPVKLKTAALQRDERLKHVIFSAQFDRGLLEHLGNIADMIRKISKSKDGCLYLEGLLSHKRAMLYFTQPSTRTFLSFMAACQILGITCNEVRDASVSSEAKGESRFDSIRTFSSYFDLIIMRSVIPSLAECCAYLMIDLADSGQRNVPIVNGGSGADEHPTQALLDIYTIQRTFQFDHPKDSSQWTRFDELRQDYPELSKGLDGKVYAFCGDIGRGRTVRSLANALTLFKDVTLIFIAPDHPKLRLDPAIRERLLANGAKVYEVESFDEHVDGKPVIEMTDCLYMTRIQAEHDSEKDREDFKKIDFKRYCLTPELVARMKDYAPIMHPFPRNAEMGEIPPSIDGDKRAMYFRQARNGMWIRAALIAYLFDMDGRILTHYQQNYLR